MLGMVEGAKVKVFSSSMQNNFVLSRYRYYHINAQRYSNPHDVIGHYTAGARLIGLTQRQMRRDMKKLTKISSDSTSPYAQPLVTSLDTFFEEQTHTKKLQFKQRKVCIISFHLKLSNPLIHGGIIRPNDFKR